MPRTDAAFRTCAKCGESKCWPQSFRSGTKCKTCWGAQQKAWGDANRVTLRHKAQATRDATREARAANLRARRARWQDKDRARERERLRARAPSPFDTTLRALEAQWGKYATWTRDQHARHSEILRRMAGIDDAPSSEERAA